MSELRQNVATRDWVIIATERAHRPEDFAAPPAHWTHEMPSHVASCPFCPGNEASSEEVGRVVEPGADRGAWRVRIVRNKFPALTPGPLPTRDRQTIFRSMQGNGYHEVLIETPLHNRPLALSRAEDVAAVMRAFRDRARDLLALPEVSHVIAFKNHGPSAGTSLEHPHGQLIALPVVPNHIRMRLEDSMRFFDEHGSCVYCSMVEAELQAGQRIVHENDAFVSFIPYAAFSPFHIWLLPKTHRPRFVDVADDELGALGDVVQGTLARVYHGIHDPDYNFVIRMAPDTYDRVPWFHWYMSIVPKVSRMAGFELGTGMYINPARPEDSAAFLRSVALPG